MDTNSVLKWFEPLLGGAIVFFVLLDVFLTVLYARLGSGILSAWIGRVTWLIFRGVAKPFGQHRGAILSFCGPAILILLLAGWAFLLTVGGAFIIHPLLARSVIATTGSTPTDFATALYASGGSLDIVGSTVFVPQTTATRLLFLFDSLVGMSVVSLTLTYLMQVYSALNRRNSLALKIQLYAANKGDATEVVAGLGPRGNFEVGVTSLAELAGEMASVKESHHFYPVLFYFRFKESFYATSRMALVCFDTITLLRSALDEEEYRWVTQAGATHALWNATMLLVSTLVANFSASNIPENPPAPDVETQARWRRRYALALERLRETGIKTTRDEIAGLERYISLRADWEYYINTLAPVMAYKMSDIDTVGHS